MSASAARRRQDKFYTAQSAVKHTVRMLEASLDAIGLAPSDCLAVEPSAGGGAFLARLRQVGFAELRAFDIVPEAEGIEEQDFLASEIRADAARRPVVVVGNPPFGKRAAGAIAFLNHAFAERASVVAFILPVQMRKWPSHKAVSAPARLILDIDLPPNAFEFEGAPYDVRSCFQVWVGDGMAEHLSDLRIKTRPPVSHPDFEIWQYNRTRQAEWVFDQDWDFAVLRQGYGDYTVLHERGAILDRKKQWILFRASSAAVRARLRALDFDALSRTNTSVRGFGKTEVVAEYCRLHEARQSGAHVRDAARNLARIEALADGRRRGGLHHAARPDTRRTQADRRLSDGAQMALSAD